MIKSIIDQRKLDINKYIFTITFILFIIITILNFIYVYSTKFKKTLTVNEKYTYGSNNSKGNQTISDNKGNIYIVKNSLYLWHWTSTELFNKIGKNEKYIVEGYGLRIPFLGFFPNITKAKKIA